MTVTEDDLALISVTEAANLAGVSVYTIRKWVYRYGIARVRRGRRVLLSELGVLEAEREARRATRGRPRAT